MLVSKLQFMKIGKALYTCMYLSTFGQVLFCIFFPIFPFGIYSDKSIRIKIILNGGKMHMPFYHL